MFVWMDGHYTRIVCGIDFMVGNKPSLFVCSMSGMLLSICMPLLFLLPHRLITTCGCVHVLITHSPSPSSHLWLVHSVLFAGLCVCSESWPLCTQLLDAPTATFFMINSPFFVSWCLFLTALYCLAPFEYRT